MATINSIFMRLWLNEDIHSSFLYHIDNQSLCNVRLASKDHCDVVTSTLFNRTRLNFTPSTLSRPSRLEALSRIGHHIERLTFSFPHTASTFLPPLLNPLTGREVTFLYTPHTSLESENERPKYGTQELGSILTDQYTPLFHAASNVPAFIRFFAQLPNLRHLSISTPDQDPAQRYRRSSVDYALISLRIALERVSLPYLTKLSLYIHPSALLYLKPTPSIGSSPRSTKFCSQIRKLKITMTSWDFHASSQAGIDHLRILDTYMRSFTRNLEKISFTWDGAHGPCPFTFPTDALFAPAKKHSKLFGEVTSPMSPLPAAPSKPQMHFPKLRHLRVRNCTMASAQVSDLVYSHRASVREFDFENVELVGGGSWEEALAPLTSNLDGGGSSGHRWRSQQSFEDSGYESKGESFIGSQNDLSVDLNGEVWPCLGEGDVLDSPNATPKPLQQEQFVPAIEIPKPRVVTTKLKKRQVKKRPHRKHNDHGDITPRPTSPVPKPLFGAVSELSIASSLEHHQYDSRHSNTTANMIFGAISEPALPLQPSTTTSSPQRPPLRPTISSPLMNTSLTSQAVTSTPLLPTLAPTVFNPFITPRRAAVNANNKANPKPEIKLNTTLPSTTYTRSGNTSTPPTNSPNQYSPVAAGSTFNSPISTSTAQTTPTSARSTNSQAPLIPDTPTPAPLNVIRNHALDKRIQELTDDPEKQSSSLKKAREAVLARLGSQFGSPTTSGVYSRLPAISTVKPAVKEKEGLMAFLGRGVFGGYGSNASNSPPSNSTTWTHGRTSSDSTTQSRITRFPDGLSRSNSGGSSGSGRLFGSVSGSKSSFVLDEQYYLGGEASLGSGLNAATAASRSMARLTSGTQDVPLMIFR